METKVENILHPGILVRPWVNRKPSKTRCIGLVPQLASEVQFGVHANSLNNVVRAINERVMYVKGPNGTLVPPPEPEPGIFFEELGYYADELTWNTRFCPKASRRQIVDSYKGGKRTLYEQARLSVCQVPIHRGDARVKAFVKAEKINLTAKGDPAPRIIQPFSTRYCLELGRYLKLNEERILNGINKTWGGKTVFSGMNVDQQGTGIRKVWDTFQDPVAIGLDATRWDQHVSYDALVYEFDYYKRLFPCDRYLSDLLDMQLVNTGIALARDGAAMYTVRGRRMSGVPNTSTGNKVLMTAIMHGYRKHLGFHLRLINNGDDCVVIVERENLAAFTSQVDSYFLRFGIEMECEDPVDMFEKIEFCQSHPIMVGESCRMVRTLHTSMAKDVYANLSLRTVADCESWLSSVGICGTHLNEGVPILHAFHSAILRGGGGRKVSTEHMNRIIEFGNIERIRELEHRSVEILPSTRVSFYRAFGVSPDVQVKLEKMFGKIDMHLGGAPEVCKHTIPPSYPLTLLTSPLPCLPNLQTRCL